MDLLVSVPRILLVGLGVIAFAVGLGLSGLLALLVIRRRANEDNPKRGPDRPRADNPTTGPSH